MREKQIVLNNLMLEKLTERYKIVTNLLSIYKTSCKIEEDFLFYANDDEECLRIIMVKLWPKIRNNRFNGTHIKEYFQNLFKISNSVKSNDIRFLDAWNNAFEALEKKDKIIQDYNQDYALFLKLYSQFLEYHIRKLEEKNDYSRFV